MSPVSKQVTSIWLLPYVMSCKRVLFASQFKSAVARSVVLFSHCQGVQLSVMMNFVILNRRMQARIKKCKFFGLNETIFFFFFLRSSHACTRESLGRALTMLHVAQAYLKLYCSLCCKAVVETKVYSKVCCIAPPTNLHMPQLS